VTTPSASEAVVIDSSGWLEYVTADTKADQFALYFKGELQILVPAMVLYEVRKLLLLRQSQMLADAFVSEALRRQIIAVDVDIALAAATISIRYSLPMADALLYATAQSRNAQFITSDAHFGNLPGVTLI
jgi:predicted nucleic acid-binding protein